MANEKADVVICGAGIAGVSAAWHLSRAAPWWRIFLVDERPPLSLTSDKSTEGYRDWWPGPDDAMIRLMSRSIDLLEEIALRSGCRLRLNRRGYLFVSGNTSRLEEFTRLAASTAALGAGPLRIHRGAPGDPPYLLSDAPEWQSAPSGADLLLDPGLIRHHFPFLSPHSAVALHTRRCGWFSGQQLGMLLLEEARQRGVDLIRASITAVKSHGGRVEAVRLEGKGGSRWISTVCFVNAAGPLLGKVGRMVGVELPVFCELHLKAYLTDMLAVVPRNAPLMIWDDPQSLPWSAEERKVLADDRRTNFLLEVLPGGAHLRPEGDRTLLLLWPYHLAPVEPAFPLPEDEFFAETALRGLVRLVPGLGRYLERLPRIPVDGGYYTNTRENRPLCGPCGPQGSFVLGALSGFGLMAALGISELLTAHIAEDALPGYAPAFRLERYADPAYQRLLANWGAMAQL